MRIWLLSIALISAVESSSVVLTKDTFDDITNKKTVFIKFFAPWCDYCKELAPHWEKMSAEWTSNEQGLVGEIDCTVNDDFCRQSFGIKGLPTLLYGDPSESGAYLQEYLSNDKSYEALSQFANETLSTPMCSPGNLDACDDETRAMTESILKLSTKELDASIQEKEDEIKTKEKEFQKQFQVMQKKYNEAAGESQLRKTRLKQTIQMLKGILESRSQGSNK